MRKKLIIFGSIIILFGFLLLFIFLYDFKFNIETNDLIRVQLDKCVDGDTAWFKLKGKSRKYRFLGIDAMEVNTSDGKVSSDYVCRLLNDASIIEMEYDSVGYTKDKYGRELVWVYVNGELLQEKILEQGYARIRYVYANYKYLDKLIAKENDAIKNKVGIWKDYNYKSYNDYYNIVFDYTYMNKNVKVLKNSMVDLIDNPYIEGCRFIGWKNGNYLFDLSTKINKDYNLIADFDC